MQRTRKRTDAETFVRALAPALRQSAAIARALEGRVANRPKRGEATAVKAALTIADSASQEALLVPLFEHFPGVRLAAEEDTPSLGRFPKSSPELVVIDPIDGTLRFFLERRGPYAVMVGLSREQRYDAALVALPREELYFDGVREGGARVARAGASPRAARLERSGKRIYVSHDLPEAAVESLRRRDYEVLTACGGAVAVAPLVPGVCAGLRMVPDPAGISIRGRIGALISAEAGALVRGADGGAFPEDIEAPARALLVAAGAKELAALEAALAAAPPTRHIKV
jgi:fructose-1,6-bisphosphatase/inositol monophosphatase family enzyme